MAERLLAKGEKGQHQCDRCFKLFAFVGNGEWIPTTCPACKVGAKEQRTVNILELACDVSAALTDRWTVETANCRPNEATLTRYKNDKWDDKWEIRLATNGYADQGRVKASSSFNQFGDWYNYTHEAPPYITVAESRGPAVVAKEIQRRLLPKYETMYNHIKKQKEEFLAAKALEIDAFGLIAEVTHGEIPAELLKEQHRANGRRLEVRFGRHGEFNWPNGIAEYYYEGRMDIQLHKLTPQEAGAVLETLIDLRAA